jgi:hypothetical protein
LIGKFPYSIIAGPMDGVMTIVPMAQSSRRARRQGYRLSHVPVTV